MLVPEITQEKNEKRKNRILRKFVNTARIIDLPDCQGGFHNGSMLWKAPLKLL